MYKTPCSIALRLQAEGSERNRNQEESDKELVNAPSSGGRRLEHLFLTPLAFCDFPGKLPARAVSSAGRTWRAAAWVPSLSTRPTPRESCSVRGGVRPRPRLPHAHCAGQLALLPLRRGRLLPGCPEVLRGASRMRCEVRSLEIVVRSSPCVDEGWREGGTGRGIQDGGRGTLREAGSTT